MVLHTLQETNFRTCRPGVDHTIPNRAALLISFVYFKRCIFTKRRKSSYFDPLIALKSKKLAKPQNSHDFINFTDINKVKLMLSLELHLSLGHSQKDIDFNYKTHLNTNEGVFITV